MAPNSVVVIEPETNEIVASIPVGAGPGPIALGGGSVWVANVEEQSLTRIDARTRNVVEAIGPLPPGFEVGPSGVAVGNGSVWLAHG
ncbi:MAG: YncE family protein [Gaiellaceae bacterium]